MARPLLATWQDAYNIIPLLIMFRCRSLAIILVKYFLATYTFFLSWHAAKSFIKNLTLESFIPTSMLSINKKTIWLGVTSNASEVPNIRVDTDSWRHLPRHLVRFSHAFPLDSFSRAAWTRSHVQCWQLSSLGKNLEFRYLQVMLIDNVRFTIPTP